MPTNLAQGLLIIIALLAGNMIPLTPVLRGGRFITLRSAASKARPKESVADVAMFIHRIRVYDNLKKTILFIMPTNLAQGLLIIIALLAGNMIPPLFHRAGDGREVVIGQHHIGRFFGDLGPFDTHRDTVRSISCAW
jgi:hypothetical protein